MGFFDKIREGLKKTKDAMMKQVETVIHSFTKVDDEFLEELEEILIMSDMGAATASEICGQLRKKIKEYLVIRRTVHFIDHQDNRFLAGAADLQKLSKQLHKVKLPGMFSSHFLYFRHAVFHLLAFIRMHAL